MTKHNRGRRRTWFSVGWVGLSLVLAVACGATEEANRCKKNVIAECACTDGAVGVQVCGENGTFMDCRCAGSAVEGGAAPDEATTAGTSVVGGSGLSDGGSSRGGSGHGSGGEGGQGQAAAASLSGSAGAAEAPMGIGGVAGENTGGQANQAGAPACVPVLELCNGIDDDCDGRTDNGEVCPDDSVVNTEPFHDGVYMVGTLKPGVSDNEVLLRVWPQIAESYLFGFPTYVDTFAFRPTDGQLFYAATFSGLLAYRPDQPDELLLTPPCGEDVRFSDAPNFGFDGSGAVFYLCDDTLRRGNGVKLANNVGQLAAVLADGRSIVTLDPDEFSPEEFVALGADGHELSRLNLRELFQGEIVAETSWATVAGNRAYVAFRRVYGDEINEVIVFRFDESSEWKPVRRLRVGGFGGWVLPTADGTVLTRDYDDHGSVITAHLPDGTEVIAWREGDQDTIHTWTHQQLLVGPP